MSFRKRLLVTGIVQGVGFRPAVARAAAAFGLSGWVANAPGGAEIEVQGPESALGDFIRELPARLPVRAMIESLRIMDAPLAEDTRFVIMPSLAEGQSRFSVPPDIAICPECRRELEDPANRRHRHAFISCGDCGPRYSYIVDLPYDRALTTMAAFPMCPECLAEYEDPSNRRYHIEGFCCPRCGPTLRGFDEGIAALRRGGIVAVKGIGGYHLACLAEGESAVAELRRRKARPTKPLAVMYPSLEALEAVARIGAEERELLLSPEAPIVLVPKERFRRPPLDALAPDNPDLGVFLPYSPLHLLLLGELRAPLVMTSANMPGDPLIIDDEAALTGLAGVVDAWIYHDRRIESRVDDSVVSFQGTRIRNGRGSVPRSIRLAAPAPRAVLAVGGELKSTVAVASGHDLVASPHIGDLENEPTFDSFRKAASRMLDYYGVEPQVIAADLHPDYESTRYAIELSSRLSIPLLRVQHHYAHLLSVLVDLGRIGTAPAVAPDAGAASTVADPGGIGAARREASGDGPFLGIILDGTGYGSDGCIWGGEILLGNARGFERVAHLRYFGLPGGEAAIREPWRILAGLGLARTGASSVPELAAVEAIAANPRLSPACSSCGRLFDAAAALLGFDRRVSFEGEAAIWLEALAAEATADAEAAAAGDTRQASTLPPGVAPIFRFAPMDGPELLRALREATLGPSSALRTAASRARDAGRAALSRLALGFHLSLALNIADEAARIAAERGLDEAFLSGGVFQNRIFTGALVDALTERGIAARLGVRVPPNDACISIGQAAYAIGAANAIM